MNESSPFIVAIRENKDLKQEIEYLKTKNTEKDNEILESNDTIF